MNVVIIDDDKEFADHTAQAIRSQGHKVSVLHTTSKAIDLLRERKPDLLILDVMFPDNPAAGFDLAREVRRSKDLAALPVILLTGVNQEFPMGFSAKDIDPEWMPVQAFLEKPVKTHTLLAKMAELTARR